MPQRYQRPYPPEFRREAVSLVKASGRSVRAVAGELGVSIESLRISVRQDQLDRGERDDGLKRRRDRQSTSPSNAAGSDSTSGHGSNNDPVITSHFTTAESA